MEKKRVLLICICAVFLLLNVSLLIAHQKVKRRLTNSDKINEKALEKRLAVERKNIEKDLEEKYRADIVSYQAMTKRLELEKAKLKAAEKNIAEITEDREKGSPKSTESIKKSKKRRR
ncbi:MAG: hypothetical protein ISS92_05200 [Candidatus Omnitrophica bacterium]|nr:hypothetical protein [Candidatus Omnitrophota bacterium]